MQGYIVSTVKNVAFSLHRKKERSRELFGDDELEGISTAESDEPYFQALQNSSVERIMRAIESPPEKYQTVIRMKCFERMPFAQISQELDEKEVTVRSWLLRGRKKLKALLEEAEDER